jgi:hypothetical protein
MLAWPLVGLGFLKAGVLAATFRGSRAVLILGGLLSVALLAQTTLGAAGRTTAHVTNGFVIWGLALALLIKAWRPDNILNSEQS